jgi:hypothetical protein
LLHIKLENGILIYCKQIAGSESYARLQLVPTIFWNIIFAAFHSDPIGGHLYVSHIASHPLAVLLAWDVLVHKKDVRILPGLCPCQPNQR